MFKPVPGKISFPRMEEDILKFWREEDIFRKTETQREGAPLFLLYEGPPTANGSPGIHHVLARVFKDVIPRYKTMQGFYAPRKGGWDTHGLPVELEVEKELGISTKQDIEAYGVEKFNARCRESVFRYVKEWEDLTERIGFWIDMKNAYVTYENYYIETAWWIIKALWDKGLIYQGMKGAPHCPRCVTTLSSHEVALGYKENTLDPSVFIKFPLKWDTPVATLLRGKIGQQVFDLESKTLESSTSFLAWTTTPWTLPGNTALAVDPDADYALVEIERNGSKQYLILAHTLIPLVINRVERGTLDVVAMLKGDDLVGLTYEKLYDPATYGTEIRQFTKRHQQGVGEVTVLDLVDDFTPRVFGADFVTLKDGTGIVHIAPAFGDEDLGAGREHGLAFVQPVNLQGVVTGTYPFSGRFVKDADEDVMDDLQGRDLLYHREEYRHTYPFCWRCETPLLYYAKNSWYIRTTAVKDRLISANQEINWFPDYIKEGRFGEWLRNNVDWAISRERYWGTPLPIWQCDNCGRFECLGSAAVMKDNMIMDNEPPSDLHRPFVDEVVLCCEFCNDGRMYRIPEVIDVWFESGIMPLAQWHYPFENESLIRDGRYPADYICEAVDQTRGWFYSLHAIATLLEATTQGEITAPSFRNVVSLGLILDAQGEKMSKSRGNVVEPWSVINAHGSDALRWYLFTAAPPGNARRFSQELVGEAVRHFLLTLWNTYSFFVTYANIDQYNPSTAAKVEPTSELDRWILSELNTLVSSVTRFLDEYNPTDTGRAIEEFVELLSNWYVRRSRRRFWKSENDEDKLSAYATLYHCLVTLSKLVAPLTPFVAEEMYQNLVRSVDQDSPESVHLASFPQADESQVDKALSEATRLAMRLSSLGRSARSKARIKVRQPVAQALVKMRSPQEEALLTRISPQVMDELNVKELLPLTEESQVIEYQVRPNQALLGPKYGPEMPLAATALASLDSRAVAARIQAGLEVRAGDYTLLPEEVQVSLADKPGYSVTMEGDYTVAVATQLSDNLIQEGLARELVHRIQNMRRSAGFAIADYIVTYYQGDQRLKQVISAFGDYIRQETLSRQLMEKEPESPAYTEEHRLDDLHIKLGVKQITA